jgi:anthranilate/para-aminobenzoate synthase component II
MECLSSSFGADKKLEAICLGHIQTLEAVHPGNIERFKEFIRGTLKMWNILWGTSTFRSSLLWVHKML